MSHICTHVELRSHYQYKGKIDSYPSRFFRFPTLPFPVRLPEEFAWDFPTLLWVVRDVLPCAYTVHFVLSLNIIPN